MLEYLRQCRDVAEIMYPHQPFEAWMIPVLIALALSIALGATTFGTMLEREERNGVRRMLKEGPKWFTLPFELAFLAGFVYAIPVWGGLFAFYPLMIVIYHTAPPATFAVTLALSVIQWCLAIDAFIAPPTRFRSRVVRSSS